MKEYIVWGIAPKKDYEEPLYSKARSLKEAEEVKKKLEKDYKCKRCRIQVLDISKEWDARKAFEGTVGERKRN